MEFAEKLRFDGEAVNNEIDVSQFNAAAGLELIDRVISDVYLPARGQEGYGTERATLVEPEHAPHRENNAEHSWHLALTILALWDNRESLGLKFPDDALV